MTNRPTWRRVSKTQPCRICGKDHACKVTADGAVAMCKRSPQGAFKASKGWFFHRLKYEPRPSNGQSYRRKAEPSRPTASRIAKVFPDAQAAIDAIATMIAGVFVAAWSYHDARGAELLRIIRYALLSGEKEYRPIHPANDGWRIGDPSGLLPLYRLHELPATGTIWVTEGEKAAEAARAVGLAATTSAHGAGSAEKTDWTPLAGRVVVLLPDHDEPGRKYAHDVARRVVKLDPPAKVKIVELPGLHEKEDVVEYLGARQRMTPEAARCEIEALANQTSELPPSALVGGPLLTCLADVQPREVQWLWPGRIPLGRITLIVGAPGEGKSFASLDIAAHVTTGMPWPDGSDCPKGSVILISAEDDPADTIRPRLDAHGADVRRVHLLSAVVRIVDDDERREMMFSLSDVAALESAIKGLINCRLVVIDPIGSFLGGQTDAYRDNEVRALLAPVARVAERYGAAVVVIAHRRKGSGETADELTLGSRAFTGIARAVWHIVRDKDNPRRRLMLPGKNNLGPEGYGLAFSIVGQGIGRVTWEREPVTMTADDALVARFTERESRPGPEPVARNHAVEWLRELLAGGPMASTKIREKAKAAGYSWRTIHRAKDELCIQPYREQFSGAWTWELPRPDLAASACHHAEEPENLASWHDSENTRKTACFEDDKSSTVPSS